MAFDGIVMYATVFDLSQHIGARIDKINQPEANLLQITMYANHENKKLLFSTGGNGPSVRWTDAIFSNPIVAPNFCMLLRKHLLGSRLVSVYQHQLDRVLVLKFSSRNDFYDEEEFYLIFEIFGRCGNVLLLQSDYTILGALKESDLLGTRSLMSGMRYAFPDQMKVNLLTDSFVNLELGASSDRFLTDHYQGFSPLISRELSLHAFGETSHVLVEADSDKLTSTLNQFRNDLISANFRYCLYYENKIRDYYCFSLKQYNGMYEEKEVDSLGELMNTFYNRQDEELLLHHRSFDLTRTVSNLISRQEKKCKIWNQSLIDAKKALDNKEIGDLLSANLWQLKERSEYAEVVDYSKNPYETLKIRMDCRYSPAQNAQIYYKKYKKAQNAITVVSEMLKTGKDELEYLYSVRDHLARVNSVNELAEVRMELEEQGIVRKTEGKRNSKSKSKDSLRLAFAEFTSPSGLKVYVGKNNLQNERLTFKFASKKSLWFHVKNASGSHAVLEYGEKSFSDEDIVFTASIVAYFSSCRGNSHVEVDYTELANVKRHSSGRPGMVYYEKYKTVYVTPSANGE